MANKINILVLSIQNSVHGWMGFVTQADVLMSYHHVIVQTDLLEKIV